MEKYIKICPKCGNTNLKSIYIISPMELSKYGAEKLAKSKNKFAASLIGWNPENPSVYICEECSYYGICPEIKSLEAEKFRKKLKSKGLK